MNVLMVELIAEDMDLDEDSTHLAMREDCIEMPIARDERYNLIVCKECGIGLPLEWVSGHLKDNHGIRVTVENVLGFLEMDGNTMSLAEAELWIQTMWVGTAVQNIPIVTGFQCNECPYSAGMKRVMTNHFSKEHPSKRMKEHSTECKVQLVFKAKLHKYIQIVEYDEMEVESVGNSEWNQAITQEFGESMANVKSSGINRHGNLRLMNVFIAKTRWDVLVEGKDLKELATLAGAPKAGEDHQRIMLCGRRYVRNACNALNRGSVIIKRRLMSGV